MKVLCAGDLHLGRRASRVPDVLDPRRFSCTVGWESIVRTSLDERVDLVALCGDLVDKDNRYFEAWGPLERGLSTLLDAGITVVVVAGNHDHHVLPRLADSFRDKAFHLLGRNGNWERHEVHRDGRPVLHIDGWSFPSEYVHHNPLADYRLQPADGVPILGLLHADLDSRQSSYAPVLLSDLYRTTVSLWLLGHIHLPRLWAESALPCVLYPGSPVAMDPGELGVHGAWLVDFRPGSPLSPRQVPLSPIRYVRLTIDVAEVGDRTSFDEVVTRKIQEHVREELTTADSSDPVVCLSYRLHITGNTRCHGQIAAWTNELQDLDVSTSQITVAIDKVAIATKPLIDYQALAGSSGLIGELASLIVALEVDVVLNDEINQLVVKAAERMGQAHRSPSFSLIGSDTTPDFESAREIVGQEAMSLLATLLAQRETA